MSAWKKFFKRVRRKVLHLRLAPVRVFCFHVVEDQFNPETTWEGDFIQTDRFKEFILRLASEGYRFISLTDAYRHISSDYIRTKKYASITFDDGVSSVTKILPWLAEHAIPVTLFVNPGFLLGEKREDKQMNLLSLSELEDLTDEYKNKEVITVGNHSYRHDDCSALSADALRSDLTRSETVLAEIRTRIPYFAYPCGIRTNITDRIVREAQLIPVLCDQQKNYDDPSVIHREII